MSKLTTFKSLRRDTRGATLVEYALILSTVLMGAGPLLGHVGRTVARSFEVAAAQFGP